MDSVRTILTKIFFAPVTRNHRCASHWSRPIALCGGANDPTVFWSFNAPVAQSIFAASGVTASTWNLEDRTSLPAGAVGDAVYAGFQQQKTAAGANATALYHGSLVPPFCNALVRGYFQQVLAAGL